MSGFLSELKVTKVSEAGNTGRALWKLEQDLVYESALIRLVTVPAGFVTDFASVPRAPIAFWLAGDTAHASAVVHDYLVRVAYPQCRVSWRVAADVFREAMRHEGVPAWRRAIMHWSVAGADPDKGWEDYA